MVHAQILIHSWGSKQGFQSWSSQSVFPEISFEWGARLPKMVRKLSNYYTLILPFAPTVSCVCGCSRDSTSSWNTDDPSAFLSLDVFSERNLTEGLLEKSPHPAHADRRTCSGSAAGAIKCLARPPFFKIRRKAELCLIIKSLEGRRVGKIALIFLNASIASIFYEQHRRHFGFQRTMLDGKTGPDVSRLPARNPGLCNSKKKCSQIWVYLARLFSF